MRKDPSNCTLTVPSSEWTPFPLTTGTRTSTGISVDRRRSGPLRGPTRVTRLFGLVLIPSVLLPTPLDGYVTQTRRQYVPGESGVRKFL